MAKGEATLLLKIKTAGQEALKSVGDNFGTLGATALGAFAAISGIVIKAVADYREQEIATNALTQAMVNNGIYSKALKDDYLAQAAAIQKITLFGDEQVIAAQAAIQLQIGEQKVTKELTLAIADLAQAKGMDLVSAAQLVGKTVGSTNNVLARQGIEFDNNTRGAERLAAVTEALNGKFGGQATAATSGLGSIKQLANVVSDLSETLGEKLAPFINLATKALKDFASDTTNTTSTMDGFVEVVKVFGASFIIVKGIVTEVMSVIVSTVATGFNILSDLIHGEYKTAFEDAKTYAVNLKDEVIKNTQDTVNGVAAIYNAQGETQKARLAQEEAYLKQSLLNKAEIKKVATEEENAKELENNQLKLDAEAIATDLKFAKLESDNAKELAAKIALQDNILKSDATHAQKMAAQKEKNLLKDKEKQMAHDKLMESWRGDTYSKIASMQNSSNSALAAAGKAAAITQIAIETPVAITRALAAFPPPFNFAAAALVGAAAASQAARVAGIPLAEGGIVKARPGGIQATIGEGGRDEAVIPLENGQIPGSNGGGVTINVYGGMLGDERTAQEFATAVDRELLKLRQNGGSVAFDRIN